MAGGNSTFASSGGKGNFIPFQGLFQNRALWTRFFIDLLAPEVFRAHSAKPERLREVSEAHKSGGTVVIDEIQKIPELLDVVHQLMEQRYGWRFILTGSSARKLKPDKPIRIRPKINLHFQVSRRSHDKARGGRIAWPYLPDE